VKYSFYATQVNKFSWNSQQADSQVKEAQVQVPNKKCGVLTPV